MWGWFWTQLPHKSYKKLQTVQISIYFLHRFKNNGLWIISSKFFFLATSLSLYHCKADLLLLAVEYFILWSILQLTTSYSHKLVTYNISFIVFLFSFVNKPLREFLSLQLNFRTQNQILNFSYISKKYDFYPQFLRLNSAKQRQHNEGIVRTLIFRPQGALGCYWLLTT